MRQLNRNFEQRDMICKVNQQRYDIVRFENLTLESLGLLLSDNFIDPEESQNDSPTVKEFYDFMKKHPEVTAHGYVVSISRSDYRTSIEELAIDKDHVTDQLLRDFVEFCNGADELEVQSDLRSWWD